LLAAVNFETMELSEFKKKLDNREFWGDNSKEMWNAAYKWQERANEEDNLIKWSWDCGLKLDYDGDVCRISSRFYPPHKSSTEYGKYHGTITVMIGDAIEDIHEHEIEATTLDELKELTEKYVSEILEKMHNAIRSLF
jgi:hypothetical protein